MEFKFNGKKIEPKKSYNRDLVKKYLDSLPDGDLVDTTEIQNNFHYSMPDYIRDRIRKDMPEYSVLAERNKCFFGNKRTIKEFKKQVEI